MELFEGAKPYDRPALAERVEQLAKSGAACADGLPGRLLLDQPLQSLHPASWCLRFPPFVLLLHVQPSQRLPLDVRCIESGPPRALPLA